MLKDLPKRKQKEVINDMIRAAQKTELKLVAKLLQVDKAAD